MTSAFADTFYFLALLDSREERHVEAAEAARNPGLRLVTTEWVLAEFGDAYCHPKDRADFVALYRSLVNHPRVKIVAAETRLFQRGVDFFEQRQDKDWSLTDCLSFVVMQDEGITRALTGDRHFEQAGFIVLLK
jgi:predicted nucleic acid-binding protein